MGIEQKLELAAYKSLRESGWTCREIRPSWKFAEMNGRTIADASWTNLARRVAGGRGPA